jgi:hypothetical protein
LCRLSNPPLCFFHRMFEMFHWCNQKQFIFVNLIPSESKMMLMPVCCAVSLLFILCPCYTRLMQQLILTQILMLAPSVEDWIFVLHVVVTFLFPHFHCCCPNAVSATLRWNLSRRWYACGISCCSEHFLLWTMVQTLSHVLPTAQCVPHDHVSLFCHVCVL